jgi:meiotically up-regulated gene 157 (Mug157) protein
LAVGVALAVYYYTSTSEQEQFEAAFKAHSTKVLEVRESKR